MPAPRRPDLSRVFAELAAAHPLPPAPNTPEEPSLPEGFFALGLLGRPHGLDGTQRLVLDVSRPEAYRKLTRVYLWQHGHCAERRVLALDLPEGAHAGHVRLEGVTSADQALDLAGVQLLLPVSELPPLGPDQFYYHELPGVDAVDAAAGPIGRIRHVVELPGQDALVIDHPSGAEVLVPIADAFVGPLDRAAGRLALRLPAGLLEVYLSPPGPADDGDEG